MMSGNCCVGTFVYILEISNEATFNSLLKGMLCRSSIS